MLPHERQRGGFARDADPAQAGHRSGNFVEVERMQARGEQEIGDALALQAASLRRQIALFRRTDDDKLGAHRERRKNIQD